jgi:hypothetical protein
VLQVESVDWSRVCRVTSQLLCPDAYVSFSHTAAQQDVSSEQAGSIHMVVIINIVSST